MKNIILMTLGLSILFIGCSSQPKPNAFPGAPKWFTKRPQDDKVWYGVGTSLRPQTTLAEKVAVNRAQQAIATQLETNINEILDDVMEASGLGLTAEVIEYNKSVGTTVKQQTLKYCKIEKTDWGRDGRCYVLVSYDVNGARKMAIKQAEQELIKYQNLKSELKGKEYLAELDKRLQKLAGQTLLNNNQD